METLQDVPKFVFRTLIFTVAENTQLSHYYQDFDLIVHNVEHV